MTCGLTLTDTRFIFRLEINGSFFACRYSQFSVTVVRLSAGSLLLYLSVQHILLTMVVHIVSALRAWKLLFKQEHSDRQQKQEESIVRYVSQRPVFLLLHVMNVVSNNFSSHLLVNAVYQKARRFLNRAIYEKRSRRRLRGSLFSLPIRSTDFVEFDLLKSDLYFTEMHAWWALLYYVS